MCATASHYSAAKHRSCEFVLQLDAVGIALVTLFAIKVIKRALIVIALAALVVIELMRIERESLELETEAMRAARHVGARWRL